MSERAPQPSPKHPTREEALDYDQRLRHFKAKFKREGVHDDDLLEAARLHASVEYALADNDVFSEDDVRELGVPLALAKEAAGNGVDDDDLLDYVKDLFETTQKMTNGKGFSQEKNDHMMFILTEDLNPEQIERLKRVSLDIPELQAAAEKQETSEAKEVSIEDLIELAEKAKETGELREELEALVAAITELMRQHRNGEIDDEEFITKSAQLRELAGADQDVADDAEGEPEPEEINEELSGDALINSLAVEAQKAMEDNDRPAYERAMNSIMAELNRMVNNVEITEERKQELMAEVRATAGEAPEPTEASEDEPEGEVTGEALINSLTVAVQKAVEDNNRPAYERAMNDIMAELNRMVTNVEITEERKQELMAAIRATAGEAPEPTEVEADTPTASPEFMQSPEFRERLQELEGQLSGARTRLAELSAQSRMKLFGRKKQKAELEAARIEYNQLLEQVASHIKSGYETEENTDEYQGVVVYGLAAEKRSIAEQEYAQLQESRMYRFMERYAGMSRKKKIAVGLAVSAGAGFLGLATGGAAVAGAGALGARFARGYMGSAAGSAEYEANRNADQQRLESILTSGTSSVDSNLGLVSTFVEQRISAEQKRNRRRVYKGMGYAAVGATAGYALGNVLDSAPGAHAVDERLGIPEVDFDDINPIDGGTVDAGGEVFDAPEVPVTPEAPAVEAFVDTVSPGEGITHTLRDLATAEDIQGLSSMDLYSIYEQFEADFADMGDSVYDMGNGDYGITNPGEFTINADLRGQLVEAMNERVGNTVAETAADTAEIPVEQLDQLDISVNQDAVDAALDAVESGVDTTPDLSSAEFVADVTRGEQVSNVAADYIQEHAREVGQNISDAQAREFWSIIDSNFSPSERADMFIGSDGRIFTETGQAGLSNNGADKIDRLLREQNLVS